MLSIGPFGRLFGEAALRDQNSSFGEPMASTVLRNTVFAKEKLARFSK